MRSVRPGGLLLDPESGGLGGGKQYVWKRRLGIPLLVGVGLMLTAAGIAYADLKAVHRGDGWDEGSNREQYAHRLNDVTFDDH